MVTGSSLIRRHPFIGVEEPRDVPDHSMENETAPPSAGTTPPDPASSQFIGPPVPPAKAWSKFGLYWQLGLMGLGVIALAGYGASVVYQNKRPAVAADMVNNTRAILNSTTALNSPRNPPAPSPLQPQAAVDAPQPKVPAAPPSDTPPQALAPPPVAAAAPPRPSPTEIMTENRKIVASPMMGDDQRQVLDLTQATNSIVLQLKHQVDDDARRMREMQGQLDDLKRMVSLSQAKLMSAATQIAMGNLQPTPQAEPAPAPPVSDAQPAAPQDPNQGPACRLKPSYTVASASPTHATLKSGGQVWISVRAPSKEFPRGDIIPCYGRILEITQENSRWVVKTDHEVIGRN